MTVGVGVEFGDGIVLATDSMATVGRGVPVTRYTNKVHVIEHDGLVHPVGVIGAGATTFIDKFLDRADRVLTESMQSQEPSPLDIVDFADRICEQLTAFLFKEYVIDRHNFFGTQVGDYSLALMVAGGTYTGELRAYYVHSVGLTEAVHGYGTIGSGAAYGELFLRDLMPPGNHVSEHEAACLAAYAIKGVEIMDPYVGGNINVQVVQTRGDSVVVEPYPNEDLPSDALEKMKGVLRTMGANMRSLLESGDDNQDKGGGGDG